MHHHSVVEIMRDLRTVLKLDSNFHLCSVVAFNRNNIRNVIFSLFIHKKDWARLGVARLAASGKLNGKEAGRARVQAGGTTRRQKDVV